MDKTFAEVWSEAQQQRSEYLVAIFSGMLSLLRRRRQQAKQKVDDAFPVRQGAVAKAA